MKNYIPHLLIFLIFNPLQALVAQQPFPFRQVSADQVRCGAERTDKYFPLIREKKIAVVANHTSTLGETHLVDSLVSAGFAVESVFSPEHGFRGSAAAGEHVKDGIDTKTGVKLVSLYGKKRKPAPQDLQDIDIVLFDMQDVGIRFYTYVSTMTYVMEACAEQRIPFLLLDRPNPNGHYVDGPVLESKFSSFVGLHPVPVVHGMTLGEYAQMVNEEGWLEGGIKCELRIIPVSGYTHTSLYQLPEKPSPNLPNMSAVYLYPSLAFFEGTIMSVGRGTDHPFQVFGHPDLKPAPFSFTPEPRPEAPNPRLDGELCHGYDLREFGSRFIRNYRQIYLFWLIESYRDLGGDPEFFTPYFDKLAGTDLLRKQIISGLDEARIRETWQESLDEFMKVRKKYLIYPDFNYDEE